MARFRRAAFVFFCGLLTLPCLFAEDDDAVQEFFDYDITLIEQPVGLGVQLDDNLVITAFAPSSVLQESGETQIGDKLLRIGDEELTSTGIIRQLLRESEYPIKVTLRANVTAERTCVAPPKGGRVEVDVIGDAAGPQHFDYLAADFTTGEHLMFEDPKHIVLADPAHACYDDIRNAEDVVGKVVLVVRGRCSFMKKIEYLERLGATGVIVSNDGSGLLHIPKPPLGGGRQKLPSIPAVMITAQAGQILRNLVAEAAESADPAAVVANKVEVKFQPDPEVARLWKEISPLLVSSTAWPEEVADRKRRYRKLSQVHHPDKPTGSKDRFEAIAEAYKRANYDLNPEVQAEYKGIDDYLANA